MRRQAAHGSHVRISVSISDEKPLHMRHTSEWQYTHNERVSISDEKPLHMRPQLDCIRVVISRVSITDDKPLHMRHALAKGIKQMVDKFQSQTRSRSTCDFTITRAPSRTAWFQSQTRSRSTCDRLEARFHTVLTHRFNLRREAAPHATQKYATAPKDSGEFQSHTRSR